MFMSAMLPPPHRPVEPTLALLLQHGLAGAGLGLVFVAGVLGLDVAHIRTLAFASPDGGLAIGMLAIGSIITFSSVFMGGAIMRIGTKDDDEPRGGHRAKPIRSLVPVPVRVGVRRARH